VTFNRLEKLKVTLSKTLDCGFSKVIVVDNCSTDGTKQYLAELQKERNQVTVINLPSNEGGAGGFHTGLEYIKNLPEKPTWCCLYDDDAYPIVPVHQIEQVLTRFEKSDTGIVASAVFLPNGEISEMNRVAKNPFKSWSVFLKSLIYGRKGFHIKDQDYHGSTIEIDTASFVGCFVNVANLIQAGVTVKSDMFIYGDDVLFSYELTEKGLKNYFEPQIQFHHDSYSYDSAIVYSSLWKLYYVYRNGLYVYQKVSKILFPAVFVKVMLQWLYRGKNYGNQKANYYRILRIAVLDYFKSDFSKKLIDVKCIVGS
jgi:GT2 family glycosyltransferase